MKKSKQKRRFIVVGAIIIIVVVVALAIVGGGSAISTKTVAQATQLDVRGQHIQVSGNVVDDSFSLSGDVLDFSIYDPDNPSDTLEVKYDQGVSATFGNGVTAICTGVVDDTGVLVCSELVTKCPSKYETASNALTVNELLNYGKAIYSKTVKVSGIVKANSVADVSADQRFVLVDSNDASRSIKVIYDGALSEQVSAGVSVVLLGSLSKNDLFSATQVSLEEK